jgi:predicted nucleic acid-binding protein
LAAILVDANALVAATDVRAREHLAVAAVLRRPPGRLVIPALCVCEATYLIERDMGPRVEAAFLEGLRKFEVLAPEPEDWIRIAELVRQYANSPLGGTDASIVALAERLETDTIITLDRRHFEAVTPKHCERFRLLPE